VLEPFFRILRWDQRGAGLSEKVHAPFTAEDHYRDLRALLDVLELPPPYYFASVAASAAIVLIFNRHHPGQVAAAVLCSPAVSVSPDRRQYLLDRAKLAAREGMRAVADASLARSFPDTIIRERNAYEEYRGRFLANDPVSYGLANRAFADSNVEHTIPTLRCPCLLLAGRHDLLRPPSEVHALAERFPDARFELIESGHLMPLQAPAAVAGHMLRFLVHGRSDGLRSTGQTSV
jgi:3-oxoadipate enol-lactonase